MIRGLGAAALLATLLAAGGASAADRQLVLEVVMNGRATGRVGEFIDRDGAVYARPSELNELGFIVPLGLTEKSEPIPLSSLPNVRAEVNEARQLLVVVADDAALRPTELGTETAPRLTPVSVSGYGALLNYDVAATLAGGHPTGGALLDLHAFSPYGGLQISGLVNITPLRGQRHFARLDTTFTHSQSDQLRRWRLGDVVTGALPWSRAVRLGGVQVASDFSLRPDLVTYPLPVISASAAVPSTVNVIVNGIQQLSAPVQPGPFAIRTLPVVTGAGEVAVTMLDALGRQTLITLPFYASAALLKPGLASYSLEMGVVREDFGQASDRYSRWAANASGRYGVTEWLTLEGHSEITGRLGLFGTGAAIRVGTLGIVNVAVAGSVGRGRYSRRATGAIASAGFQRVSHRLSVSASATYATIEYSDIAAEHGAPMPKATLNASLAYQFGGLGNIGVAYNGRISRPQLSEYPQAPDHVGAFTNSYVELITASYSVPLGHRANFYATGFKDLSRKSVYGAGIGISLALGGSAYGSVEASLDGGRSAASVNIAKSAQQQGDFGYRLRELRGAAPHRSAEGEYFSRWGRVSAGVDHSSSETAARAGARGGLAWAGGHLFAGDQIQDSFAVVSTGDVPGVPVLYQNRPAGSTDARGKLLIPWLQSYQDNRLAIDTTRLSPDIEVGQTSLLVRPPDRSGVMVDFHIRKANAALLTLHGRTGRPIPLGSVAKVKGAEDQPVGYDGKAYVTGLKPTNQVDVLLPDGTGCSVQFAYRPIQGNIPLIGPLVCR
ncbi:MAG TPA: fimbria/pilus outer membrane usher protein [Sphingomonas sp.]|nr:fimbria/pilus outer membrane usher protein [Sphingomonas sp.]